MKIIAHVEDTFFQILDPYYSPELETTIYVKGKKYVLEGIDYEFIQQGDNADVICNIYLGKCSEETLYG